MLSDQNPLQNKQQQIKLWHFRSFTESEKSKTNRSNTQKSDGRAKVQFMIYKGSMQNVNSTMAQKEVFVDFLVLKGTYLTIRSHTPLQNQLKYKSSLFHKNIVHMVK